MTNSQDVVNKILYKGKYAKKDVYSHDLKAPVVCPHCKSTGTVLMGIDKMRQTTKYACTDCKGKFVVEGLTK